MPEDFRAGFHFHLDDEVERFVEQLRKWMGRVNGQRRQDRQGLGAKKALQPLQVRRSQVLHLDKAESVFRQGGGQLIAPAGLLFQYHAPDARLHRAQRFRRRQAIQAADG